MKTLEKEVRLIHMAGLSQFYCFTTDKMVPAVKKGVHLFSLCSHNDLSLKNYLVWLSQKTLQYPLHSNHERFSK